MTVIVLMPCLNDSATSAELVMEVSAHLAAAGHRSSFLLVDDGSTPPLAESLQDTLPHPPTDVHVLRMSRNLGHQRAIACGLCYLDAKGMEHDAVVIMDSDGEDRPEDVPRLVDELSKTGNLSSMVFAERKRRSEGAVFRTGYFFYLGLHRLLLGQAPRVGNFSALHFSQIRLLVTDPDLWSHYAATIWKSRIKRLLVPVARGYRRRGSSHLNLGALILHGLAAISCYRETLVLRVLIGSACLLALSLLGFATVVIDTWLSAEPTFSPHVVALGITVCMFFQISVLALWQCFNVLQNRPQATFIPARDFVYFAPDEAAVLKGPQ